MVLLFDITIHVSFVVLFPNIVATGIAFLVSVTMRILFLMIGPVMGQQSLQKSH